MAQAVDRTKRTPSHEEKFLASLRSGASVYKSALAAGVARQTVYDWRHDDEDFKARWDEAVECGTDVMEDEAKRRGVDGVTKPVFYQGEVCGTIQEYSDMLLDRQLRARRRDKYSEKTETNLTATVHVKRLVFTDDEE